MKANKNTSGFTLVELIITLFILIVAAVGLMSFLISIQYLAEDNLYESTALTVALSTLEQMKSRSADDLSTSQSDKIFELTTSDDETTLLNLQEANSIQVPLVTDIESTSLENTKMLPLTIIPRIETAGANIGYWLEVQYAYDHPQNGRTRTNVVRCMRSKVRNY